MEKAFFKTINSPIGYLVLESTESALCSISFSDTNSSDSKIFPEILQQTEEQLQAFFSGNLKEFDVELDLRGSEFQQKVWSLVKNIVFGETASYLDISKKLGAETYTRAVGMANGKNPIPIIIPCHRVIGTNGKLTGYAGGLERKRWLLLHEQSHTKGKTLF